MCVWSLGYPPIFSDQLYSAFSAYFFPNPICIRIYTLWTQLLLDFSANHLETMRTCSAWSNMCVWFGDYPAFIIIILLINLFIYYVTFSTFSF